MNGSQTVTDVYKTVMEVLGYFYHMDNANARIHMKPVKFSPITFTLATILIEAGFGNSPIVKEVHSHEGRYELDPGR